MSDVEGTKKFIHDAISEVNQMYNELSNKVENATQWIEKVDMDFISLRKKNDIHREFCVEKLSLLAETNPQQSHHLLTDKDGEIDSEITKIQMANCELLDFLETIKALLKEISQDSDLLYRKLESIDEHILNHEINSDEFSRDLASVEDSFIQCFESLNPHKERLRILLPDIISYQEEISSWNDALRKPEIITIPPARLQTLWTHLSGRVNFDTGTIRHFADDVLTVFDIYQLKCIVDMQPMTDVTVIECWKQIRFAFWKLKKEATKIHGNIWETTFGEVMNQLEHEICWAITSAELVSVIRFLEKLDVPRIDYSAQYLVDFTKSDLRGMKRPSTDHFCYTCDVEEALDYVRVHGIETEQARPFLDMCEEYVAPKNSSNLGYIRTVEKMDTLEESLQVVERHPVAASIPIFEPEYIEIKDKIYRGPTSRISKYRSMHAGNITGGGEENGEKYVWLRTSHGKMIGVHGYLKVSTEVMAMCITRGNYEGFIEHPFPLLTSFVYPTMLTKEEEDTRRKKAIQASRKEEVRSDVTVPSKKV
uniref:Cathepsin L-like proteinase n=1 Tax=Noccaea caerulescens TaxID=107243 RepID=A0A1J3HW27_NOCCA